jgi:transposase ISL3 family protein
VAVGAGTGPGVHQSRLAAGDVPRSWGHRRWGAVGSSRCRHTRMFDIHVAWLVTQTSKTAVVELMRTSWRIVGAIARRVVAPPGSPVSAQQKPRLVLTEIRC